jgi:dihydrofolate synthase / folylpolyglutamate synthase
MIILARLWTIYLPGRVCSSTTFRKGSSQKGSSACDFFLPGFADKGHDKAVPENKNQIRSMYFNTKSMDESHDIARRLFSRTTHGIKLGLERMRSAAARFNDPQNSYPSIHIAGTNGKGSTCAYIEAVLRSQGYRTGLFTSPHIVSFEERFIISGRPVSSGQWVDVYRDLESTIEEFGLTFFEAATLIAFELFKRERVDYAVFETGMGGRLDSTNIVVPRACAITRIAMDHMAFLGNDLISIAREKLGIVKRGVTCVMAAPEAGEIRDLAQTLCDERDVRLEFADSATDAQDTKAAESGVSFTYDNQRFSLPLAGSHQVQNAVVAIRTLRAAGVLDLRIISNAMEKTFLPGRFHVITAGEKTIVFDVGHNPDAAQAFTQTCSGRFADIPLCLVIGIMKDKDMSGMFQEYCKKAKEIYLTRPDVERSADVATLKSHIPSWFSGTLHDVPCVVDAVRASLTSPEKVTGVVGSFFTVGEAMAGLGVSPYPMM